MQVRVQFVALVEGLKASENPTLDCLIRLTEIYAPGKIILKE